MTCCGRAIFQFHRDISRLQLSDFHPLPVHYPPLTDDLLGVNSMFVEGQELAEYFWCQVFRENGIAWMISLHGQILFQ